MASQQVLFAETIMAMKKAIKRKAYGRTTCAPLLSPPPSADSSLPQNPIRTKKSNTTAIAARR